MNENEMMNVNNEEVENDIVVEEDSGIGTGLAMLIGSGITALIQRTGKGETLFYDALSGRYFKSDINELKRVMNDMNFVMLNETGISLNEVYHSIGLDGIKLGENLGWNIGKGMVEMRFSTQLSDGGQPCIVMDFATPPYAIF